MMDIVDAAVGFGLGILQPHQRETLVMLDLSL
jgi:hypothetical protein